MIRFNILVFSRSITARHAAACAMALALCGISGCNTYGADLLVGSALSGGGGGSLGSAGAGTAGADPRGEAGDAGASLGGTDAGGSAGDGGAAAGGKAGAGGGVGGTAGAGGTGGFGVGGAVVVDPNLIDDLEDDDSSIVVFNNPRRDGIWDTGHDMSVGGVQTPAQYMFKPTLITADPPYPGDQYAAYTKGSGFTTYGAYMNVSMRSYADYAKTPQYDASAYKGLSFLAKAGATASKKMRVRFISGDTDPRGLKCKTTGAQTELCYNHYFSVVTLTGSWRLYHLDFTNDFAQGGDGMINASIDLAGMYGLEFYFDPGTQFEVWIDDLTFLK